MRKTYWTLLLVFIIGVTPICMAEQASPAMQAYEKVSMAREKHDAVVWQNAPATDAELRTIVQELGNSIKMLDEPLNSDLGEGNLYLRYRRFNLLVDLVKINARLGQNDQSIKHWHELMLMDWAAEPGSSFTDDPHVKKIMMLPEYQPIQRKYVATNWWSNVSALKTPYQTQLSVEERIAGLSRIWTITREGFVWFDNVPALDWDKSYLDYLPKVIAAKDTEAYYRVLIEFVTQLKDGHSNVYVPEALADKLYSRPGVRTRLIEGKVIVTRIADKNLEQQGLVVGDEVVRVDGEEVFTYAKRNVEPLQSSSTLQDLEVRKYAYGLLSGDSKASVKLLLKNSIGREYEIIAPRSGFTFIPATQKPIFEMRADGVAILRASQFENDDALKAFTANLTKVMSAKGLVIDLRGNGGGDTMNGWEILSYLSEKPVTATAAFYRENSMLDLARSKTPSIRWRKSDVADYDAKRKQIFQGPVTMLIDAQSFSAAEDTAAAFKLMKRGKIVGMPSGGSTGQPFLFSLPGGGTARICVKRDTYPDGSNFVGVGVLPDVAAALTVSDIRKDTDSAMETAVKLLLQK